MRTQTHNFVGQNIKGTPKMPAGHVRHDLRKVRHHATVYVLQEFKWSMYWHMIDIIMTVTTWSMFPNRRKGLADPIYGAQAVGWRKAVFKKMRSRVVLLMDKSPFTTKRYIRAVCLRDRKTKMDAWYGTTHFQVGGDRTSDRTATRQILNNNIDRLHDFLMGLKRTGLPIMFELDANIARDSATFKDFYAMVHGLGGRFHGTLGVEYAFTIIGKDAHFVIEKVTTIPTSQLYTDHEGRVLTFHLASNRGA